MNRKSLLALLATIGIWGALCAAVPHLVDESPVAPTTMAAATGTAPATATGTAPATQAAASTAPATQESRVTQMRETAEQTSGLTAYVTLFIVLILSGLGLPLPEEVPLLLAGYLARHEAASLYIMIPVALAGALTADVILFMAAKRWRSHIFRWRWMRAMIRPRTLVKARRQFHKHGLKIVVVARWLPALRTAVCLTAGLTGVKPWRFILVDATAACITVPTSILVGYFAAQHIDAVIAGIVRAEHFVLMGVLAAVAAALFYRFVWWRRAQSPARFSKPLPPQDQEAEVSPNDETHKKPHHRPTHRNEVA